MKIVAVQVIAKTILYVTVPDEVVASSEPEALVGAIEPIVAAEMKESSVLEFFGLEGGVRFTVLGGEEAEALITDGHPHKAGFFLG